jgi:K(+)-stimulated pyrophosphate-energized sodium pump
MTTLAIIIICGLLSIAYGVWATLSVLSADAGSPKMQEISAAVREGAQAYLKRQYTTIGAVGVVIFVIVGLLLGWLVAVGFAIGAVLSGSAGFIGMNISVRANVRTAEAARTGLNEALQVAARIPMARRGTIEVRPIKEIRR